MAFYTWHKIADPATGWLASKATNWVADLFTIATTSASAGLEVDFSTFTATAPQGMRAVRVQITQWTTLGAIYYRKAGDANISNTPNASQENSHQVMGDNDNALPIVIWLSSDYKAQFTVTSVDQDLAIAYPIEWLG